MEDNNEIAKNYLIASLTGAKTNELETIQSKSNLTIIKFMGLVDTVDISKEYPLIEKDIFHNCVNAFSLTSFDPEKRALNYIHAYNEELKNDLIELGENTGNYKEKYISKFLDLTSAKSRCYSVMITGGSNFNNDRHEKANRSERNKNEQFSEWRERYFKAVNRERTKTPEEDLFEAEKKLIKYEEKNERVKRLNKVISPFNRKKEPTLKDAEDCNKKLVELGFFNEGEELTPCEWRGKLTLPTIGTYGIKIKKQKERIFELKQRIEIKETFKDIAFDGGYITISDDRVKIFHDERPEIEIIQNLKKSGFKWSRFWGCWCRKNTVNAIIAAKRIVKTNV